MEQPLFSVLATWASTSRHSLARQGWTVLLEGSEEDDYLVVELENDHHLGRFVLQDIGRVEIGVLDKATGDVRRGECEVYTEGQLEDAVTQFLGWLGQSNGQVQQVKQVACPHNKIIYDSRPEAIAVVRAITSRTRMPGSITEYQCHLCHKWHIGGRQGRVGIKRRSFPS